MLTNSRDIIRRLEHEGWITVRITGSHHVFKHPDFKNLVTIVHPKKDLGKGWFVPFIKALDGNPIEIGHDALHRNH